VEARAAADPLRHAIDQREIATKNLGGMHGWKTRRQHIRNFGRK